MAFDFLHHDEVEMLLEADRAKARRHIPTADALSSSLHQIALERMTLNGHPSTDMLFTLLRQHDSHDVGNITAVVKITLRLLARSHKYYIYRFKRLVSAVRFIRHVWLASRFRFAVKISSIVAKWGMEEEDARKERSRESANARRERAMGRTSSFDYLSIAAPLELKKRVLLTQYRRLQQEFLVRWNIWWRKKKQYDKVVRDTQYMHPDKRAHILNATPEPPPEPEFRWFQALNSLTHDQLFELSLKVQHAMNASAVKKKIASGEAQSTSGNAVDDAKLANDFLSKHDEVEDDWVLRSLVSVTALSDQHRQRSKIREGGSRSKWEHITSRLFTDMSDFSAVLKGGAGRGSLAEVSEASERKKARSDRAEEKRRVFQDKVKELRSMPTLSRFKSTNWSQPPRPLPPSMSEKIKVTLLQQKKSDPPTLAKLDPMLQSLCTRGIFHAPATPPPYLRKLRVTSAGNSSVASSTPTTRSPERDRDARRLSTSSSLSGDGQGAGKGGGPPSPAPLVPRGAVRIQLPWNPGKDIAESPSRTQLSRSPNVSAIARTQVGVSPNAEGEEEEEFGYRSLYRQPSLRRDRHKDIQHAKYLANQSKTMNQVKIELQQMPATYCSVKEILRSQKAIQITLGINPTDTKASSDKVASIVNGLSTRATRQGRRPASAGAAAVTAHPPR